MRRNIKQIIGNLLEKLLIVLFLVSVGVILFVNGFNKFYVSELIISFLPQAISISALLFLVSGATIIYRKSGMRYLIALVLGLMIPMIYGLQIVNFYSNSVEQKQTEEPLSVLSSNLFAWNKNYSGIEQMIKQKNPDIIIFAELTQTHQDNLSILKDYPFYFQTPSGIGYTAIYSKQELKDVTTHNPEEIGRSYIITETEKHGEKYTIIAVHTPAPITSEYFEYRNNYLENLAGELIDRQDHNLIVMGDFNTSPWSYYFKGFQDKTSNFLIDASAKEGFVTTWSPFVSLLSVHLDHSFVSSDLEINHMETINLEGSDHDAIFLEINSPN